jgi:hypothetical protein
MTGCLRANPFYLVHNEPCQHWRQYLDNGLHHVITVRGRDRTPNATLQLARQSCDITLVGHPQRCLKYSTTNNIEGKASHAAVKFCHRRTHVLTTRLELLYHSVVPCARNGLPGRRNNAMIQKSLRRGHINDWTLHTLIRNTSLISLLRLGGCGCSLPSLATSRTSTDARTLQRILIFNGLGANV